MAMNEYRFVTHWRVRGNVEEVWDILNDAVDLARWWPSVYLDVQEHGTVDEKIISLYTKGWLPYFLRWQFRRSASNYPSGFEIEAFGDLAGRGVWTFEPDGEWVNITYDWQIRADKPLLRYGSPIFKPVFAANHRWAMKMGEQSLKLELARRHARTEHERSLIPPPPGPINMSPVPLLAGSVGALAGILGLVYALASRGRRM